MSRNEISSKQEAKGTGIAQAIGPHAQASVTITEIKVEEGAVLHYHQPLLMSWFERWTKLFWLGSEEHKYLQSVANALERDRAVSQAYTELFSSIPPGRLIVSTNNTIKLLSELIAEDRNCLMLLGKPGSGKTTSLKHFTLEAAKVAIRKFRGRRIPIYADLRSYHGENLDLFLSTIVRGYGSEKLSRHLKGHLADGRLTVFFDAVDAMPGGRFYNNLEKLRDFVNLYPRNRYIFACRPDLYNGEIGIEQAYIEDLDDATIMNYLKNHIGDEAESLYQELVDTGKRGSYALDLVRNPLFLSMFIATRHVAETKGLLIGDFAHRLIQRDLVRRWADEN